MPADEAGIPVMPGHAERVERAERLLAAARAAGIPVVFFQEVHRPSGVDFGRELDGVEGVHCVEGQPGTDLEPSLRPEPGEFHIVKRRYSGLHRHRIRHRAARIEGRHADPRRRSHRRLRALHVRRRPPARLLRPRGHRLRRRIRRSTGTTRRWTRWSTCRPVRCAPPTKSSPPSVTSHELPTRPPPFSKEPPDDHQIPRHGGRRRSGRSWR